MNEIDPEGINYKMQKFWGTMQYFDLKGNGEIDDCSWFWGCVTAWFRTVLGSLGGLMAVVFVLWTICNFAFFLLGGFFEVLFGYVDIPILIINFGIFGVYLIYYIPTMFIQSCDGKRPWVPTYLSKYFPTKEVIVVKPKASNTPNILKLYYTAYKNKLCPILKIKEKL